MNRPNPPPQLPKDKEPRDVFQRWLYNFWEYVVGGSPESDQSLLAVQVFERAPTAVTLGQDAQRILEGQIFGG